MKAIAFCAPVALGVAAILGSSSSRADARPVPVAADAGQGIMRIEIMIAPTQKNYEIKLSDKKKAVDVYVLQIGNFNPSQIDPPTIDFAGALPVNMNGNGSKDVNNDGKADKLYRFEIGKLKLTVADTMACFTGKLALDNQPVRGCDKIKVVE
jgi:hypothetical protein